MIIKYQFITGENNEVQVTEEMGELLLGLDNTEKNDERRETRRHVSLASMEYEGDLLADDTDVAAQVCLSQELTALKLAMNSISPQQRDLLVRMYLRGEKLADIARELGVTKQSISERLNRALKKLKNVMG